MSLGVFQIYFVNLLHSIYMNLFMINYSPENFPVTHNDRKPRHV